MESKNNMSQDVGSLIDVLKDSRWRIREDAVEALIKIGEPAVIPLICTLETQFSNRYDVVRVLGKIGDFRAVELLIDALDTPNHFLTQEAAIGLGTIGDTRAIYPLINVFRLVWDDTETITTWQKASDALAAFGEPALRPLLAALSDENDNVRHWSTETLGKITDPRTVEPLIHALQDKEFYVRAAAAESLGRSGESRVVEPLVSLLRDENAYVRLRVCYALGAIGDVIVFEPLISVLSDLEPNVRSAAVVNLGRVCGMLISGLDSEPISERRQEAIETLKRVQGERLLELLIMVLKDNSDRVSAAAARELGRLGDERALPALLEIQNTDAGSSGVNKTKDAVT